MKSILIKLGLEGILRFENANLGWIEAFENRYYEFKNLISNEEIMKDLNYGVN